MSFLTELLENEFWFGLLIPAPIFLIGAWLLLYSHLRFYVPKGYIAIKPSKSKMYCEGWNW